MTASNVVVQLRPTQDEELQEEQRLVEIADLGIKPIKIPIDKVQPDPDQSRSYFDPEFTSSIAKSMQKERQKQPLIVAPANADGIYIICGGENRYRGCIIAGFSEIWVIVDPRVADPLDRHLIGFTDNYVQQPMIPFDIAHALLRQKEERKISVAKLAEIVPFEPHQITRYLKLARMNQEVAKCTIPNTNPDSQISANTAYMICDNIPYEDQPRFLEKARTIARTRRQMGLTKKQGIPGRVVNKLISDWKTAKTRKKKPDLNAGVTPEGQNILDAMPEEMQVGTASKNRFLALQRTLERFGRALEDLYDNESMRSIQEAAKRLNPLEYKELVDFLIQAEQLRGILQKNDSE